MRKVNINAKTIKSRLQSLWLSVTRKSFESNFWVLQNVFSFRQRQIRKRDRLGFTTLLNKRVSFGRPSEYAYLIRKGEKRLMEFYYGFRKPLLLSFFFYVFSFTNAIDNLQIVLHLAWKTCKRRQMKGTLSSIIFSTMNWRKKNTFLEIVNILKFCR